MAILSFNKSATAKLSKNFKVSEFHCKGARCCSKTLVSEELIERLQILRELAGAPITINSGYRCYKHNRAVGGASSSQHINGKAADVVISGKSAKQMAVLAEQAGFRCVLLYSNRIHVDVRDSEYKYSYVTGKKVASFSGKNINDAAKYNPYTRPSSTCRKGMTAAKYIRYIQWAVNASGISCTVDGVWGNGTTAAIRAFQKKNGLNSDGVVGVLTIAALAKVHR